MISKYCETIFFYPYSSTFFYKSVVARVFRPKIFKWYKSVFYGGWNPVDGIGGWNSWWKSSSSQRKEWSGRGIANEQWFNANILNLIYCCTLKFWKLMSLFSGRILAYHAKGPDSIPLNFCFIAFICSNNFRHYFHLKVKEGGRMCEHINDSSLWDQVIQVTCHIKCIEYLHCIIRP